MLFNDCFALLYGTDIKRDRMEYLHLTRSGWPISDASSWLGIPNLDVVRLAKSNVLALLDGAEKNDQALWVFSRKTVEDFFEKITNRLELFSGDAFHLCRLC
jgi:hypothetical protein